MRRRSPLWGHDPDDAEHPQAQPVPIVEWRRLGAKVLAAGLAVVWARPRLADGYREGATLLVAVGATLVAVATIDLAFLDRQRMAERIFLTTPSRAGAALATLAVVGGVLIGLGLGRGA